MHRDLSESQRIDNLAVSRVPRPHAASFLGSDSPNVGGCDGQRFVELAANAAQIGLSIPNPPNGLPAWHEHNLLSIIDM